VEVARDRNLWKQDYARGKPKTKLIGCRADPNRRGTTIRFKPDTQIFGAQQFSPARLYRLCRSKAYLFRGVKIRWACDPSLLKPTDEIRRKPNCTSRRLRDSLEADIGRRRPRGADALVR